MKILKGNEAKEALSKLLSDANASPYNKPYVTGYYLKSDNVFVAFDNTTADCWVEEFTSDKEAEEFCSEVSPESPAIVKDLLEKQDYGTIFEIWQEHIEGLSEPPPEYVLLHELSGLIAVDENACIAISDSLNKEDEKTSDNKKCPVCDKEFLSDKSCSCGFSGKGIKLESPIIITVDGGCVQSVDNVPSDKYVEVRDYDIDGSNDNELKTDDDGDKYILSVY